MSSKETNEPFYSTSRRAGNLIYFSGFGPVDKGLHVIGSDIEDQTTYTMDLISEALADEGVTFNDLVRVNVFLKDMNDRDKFNSTYMRYFNGPMPTRRLIGAGDLFKGILVEIDCVAYLPSTKRGS